MANSALIDDLERQFAENPRRVFARLANEYRKSGDFERAIEICQVHVPQQPGYISGYIVMGQALFESGRLDEAHATFQTALDLDPENLIALRHLGDIARQTGDANGARIWYQRLLEIDPQNEEIALQLSELSPSAAEPSAATGEAPAATMEWGDINPEQDQEPAGAEAVGAEPAYAGEQAAPTSHGDTDSATVLEAPSFESTASDALAEHEPLDLHEEASVLDAHVASVVEPSVAHANPLMAAPDELPQMHEDFGPADIIPETDPFAQPDDMAAPSLADLSFDGEAVVELSSLEARDSAEQDSPPGIDAARAEAEPPAIQAADHGDSAHAAFVTETMAELYLEQGHRQEALRIFRQLSEQDPDSEGLRHRVQRLAESPERAEAGNEPPVAPAYGRGRPERTMRRFLAALADRRPPRAPAPPQHIDTSSWSREAQVAGSSSPGSTVSPHEEAAAHSLAAAFSEDYHNRRGGNAGQPARVASNELSLDEVFRDSRSRGEGHASRAVSFDEFFSPRPADSSGGAEGQQGVQSEQARPSSDLELFHAWLEGLKK